MEAEEARAIVHQLEGFEQELESFVASVERRMPQINVIPSVETTLEKLKTLQIEAGEKLQEARQAVPA